MVATAQELVAKCGQPNPIQGTTIESRLSALQLAAPEARAGCAVVLAVLSVEARWPASRKVELYTSHLTKLQRTHDEVLHCTSHCTRRTRTLD